MPSETKTTSYPSVASSQKTNHPVEYRDGAWRCSLTYKVWPVVVGSGWTKYSKVRTRTWVRSSPWPVPVGQLKPVNPYSVTTTETVVPVCSWDVTLKEQGTQCYSRTDYVGPSPCDGGCNTSALAVDSARSSWLNGRAMLNFLLKVKDQKSQILVTLAESRQTVEMISGIAKTVAGLRKKWLGKQPRSVRKSERKLHSSWLEYRYGWMPLYYDAYGITSQLLEKPDTRELYPVRGVARWETDSQQVVDWPAAYWKGKVLRRDSHRYKAMVGGFISVTNRTSRELVRSGLTNPLELAWEVLPYSFVVDWLISVGDYIEGMTALSGVTLTNCWASIQTDTGTSKSPLKTTYPTTMTIHNHPPNATRQMKYNRWSVNPSLLHVPLNSLVDFNLQKQSWKHWVDSAALLKARFRER